MQQHSDPDGTSNPKSHQDNKEKEEKRPEEDANLRPGLTSGGKTQFRSVCNVTDSSAASVTHPGESRPNIQLLLPDTRVMPHFLPFHLNDADKGAVDMHRI